MKKKLPNLKISTILAALKKLPQLNFSLILESLKKSLTVNNIKTLLTSKKLVNFKTISILVSLLLLGLLLNNHQQNNANQAIIAIKITNAKITDLPLEIQSSGSVITPNNVIISPRVSSQITAVLFHDGDYVKKDQLLFVLDDKTLKAELDQLQANLEGNLATLDNLNLQYQRSDKLAKQGFDTIANLDTAKSAYETQKANIDAIKAQIENVNLQIEYTQIRSPIDGRAGMINVTTGNNVTINQTQPLVTISQISPIAVQTSLPQKYLDIIRQKITNDIKANDIKAKDIKVIASHDGNIKETGTLEAIDNNIDPATNNFIARASFDNPNEDLWPGMFVDLTIILNQAQLLTIPEVAIQHSQDGDFVFIIGDDHKASKQNIKVSYIQNGIAVIESGLQNNQKVAIDGLMFLKDGSFVSYTEPQIY